MKQKKTAILLAALLAVTACFAGCAGQKDIKDEVTETIAAETVQEEDLRGLLEKLQKNAGESETGYREEQLQLYQQLMGMGIFRPEDFEAQAEIYQQQNKIDEAVLALERACRLDPTEQRLQNAQALSIPSDSTEALAALCAPAAEWIGAPAETLPGFLFSEDWFSQLMPTTRQGLRRYSVKSDSGDILLEVGFDPYGGGKISIWQQKENTLRCLAKDGEEILFLESGIRNGQPDGAFTFEKVSAAEESVLLYKGQLKDGHLTGDFSARTAFGVKADSLSEMWETRAAAEGEVFTGSFSEEGKALAPQHPELTEETGVICAYTADEKQFLWFELPPDSDGVFTADTLGLPCLPAAWTEK